MTIAYIQMRSSRSTNGIAIVRIPSDAKIPYYRDGA